MRHLALAAGGTLTAEEQRLLKLADWMGVPTRVISAEGEAALMSRLLDEGDGERGGLALSARTLARARQASPQRLERLVRERGATLLVFGWDDHHGQADALSWLTGGKVRGIASPAVSGESVVDLPRGGREVTQQLAGLRFSTGAARGGPAFDGGDAKQSPEAIMLMNGRVAFLRLKVAACEVFLLAGSNVPDIDEALSPVTGLEAHYDRLIPFLAFFRYVFGETCWHGPGSTARFTLDDPLLAERYGFLDYRALLSSMEGAGYGTTIAFIPWNYRRTSNRTAARLFRGRSDLSICVHGCDHTNGEFEGADEALLEQKAGLALDRMAQHEKRTGLPFERVMIFPQGRFSADAMRALRATGYLGAVNSTSFPSEGAPGAPRMADFLRPAITRFHGLPIFGRRYPRRLVDSAFDMFLGRPALLVEHHPYFREGCGSLEKFVRGLQELEPKLTWPTLSSQLMRSCIMRSVARDSVEVQFFTRRFQLENTGANRRRFHLAKPEPDPSAIRAVLVDGTRVPFWPKADSVQVELEADPGQVRHVEVVDHPRPSRAIRRMGWGYHASVFARRGLSEFRDNTLARHPRLLQAATGLARSLKLTSDSH